MIKLIGIAALAAMMAVPAHAQTPIGATTRQCRAHHAGYHKCARPEASNRTQKSLDRPSGK